MEEGREKLQGALDTEHIVRTYFHLALPVVVGSIITIIYSLADTYFIAQTGNALLVAGVSVCAPLFTVLMAFGNIFGQGGSSLISRLLGRKETETVRHISSFCFYIALLTGTVVGGGMLLFRDPLLGALGASSDTLPYAAEYATVLLAGAPLIVANFIHMNLLRCEGMAGLSMAGTVIGSVVNVILDPLMIPSMGAAGAAAATVIGYLCSDAFLLLIVLRKSAYLSVVPRLRVTGVQVKDILGIGITAAVTNLASSLCVVLINQQLLPYGDEKIVRVPDRQRPDGEAEAAAALLSVLCEQPGAGDDSSGRNRGETAGIDNHTGRLAGRRQRADAPLAGSRQRVRRDRDAADLSVPGFRKGGAGDGAVAEPAGDPVHRGAVHCGPHRRIQGYPGQPVCGGCPQRRAGSGTVPTVFPETGRISLVLLTSVVKYAPGLLLRPEALCPSSDR